MKPAIAIAASSPVTAALDVAHALSLTGIRVSLSLTGDAAADELCTWAGDRGMLVVSQRLERWVGGRRVPWRIEQVLLGHGGDITVHREDEAIDGGAV